VACTLFGIHSNVSATVTHILDNSFALSLACCIQVFKAIMVEKTMLLVSLTDETIIKPFLCIFLDDIAMFSIVSSLKYL
jgi:hypothetical protein